MTEQDDRDDQAWQVLEETLASWTVDRMISLMDAALTFLPKTVGLPGQDPLAAGVEGMLMAARERCVWRQQQGTQSLLGLPIRYSWQMAMGVLLRAQQQGHTSGAR